MVCLHSGILNLSLYKHSTNPVKCEYLQMSEIRNCSNLIVMPCKVLDMQESTSDTDSFYLQHVQPCILLLTCDLSITLRSIQITAKPV
jgi:hypothetical protein